MSTKALALAVAIMGAVPVTAPAAGKKIVIYYLPDDPGDSYVTDHHTLFDAALLVGFGALLWGGGGWYAWRR